MDRAQNKENIEMDLKEGSSEVDGMDSIHS
jgi:hypothetical protein